jgi:hypothetical protein
MAGFSLSLTLRVCGLSGISVLHRLGDASLEQLPPEAIQA